MVKPKLLRIIGISLASFAVVFGICLTLFDTFIAPLKEEINLLFFILVLLNLLQATLLLVWADILDSRK
jgi:hypothetical protein